MLERIDFWLVLITLGFLAWLESRSLRRWIGERVARLRSVKSYEEDEPIIMSRSEDGVPPSAPSSLETDGRRTETTAPGPKFTEDQLLTLYGFLRELGVTRDRATPILKASGIPVNNNLWTRAAPLAPDVSVGDDDTTLTPIAGRRTRASYYPEEPDLEFSPPPR